FPLTLSPSKGGSTAIPDSWVALRGFACGGGASNVGEQLEQRVGGACHGAGGTEHGSDLGEAAHHGTAADLIGQERPGRVGEVLRVDASLKELRLYHFAEEDVDHADVVDVHEGAGEGVLDRPQAVGDHRRNAEERGFERGRAGRL